MRLVGGCVEKHPLYGYGCVSSAGHGGLHEPDVDVCGGLICHGWHSPHRWSFCERPRPCPDHPKPTSSDEPSAAQPQEGK